MGAELRRRVIGGFASWRKLIFIVGLAAAISACSDSSSNRGTPAPEDTLGEVDEHLSAAAELLASDVPPTSEAAFADTEFAQSQMEPRRRARLDRAHALVMAAEDPEPDWFATTVDRDVIVAGRVKPIPFASGKWMSMATTLAQSIPSGCGSLLVFNAPITTLSTFRRSLAPAMSVGALNRVF
ncbi:hypothetical protein CAI21_14450 [Alkalilimnicola ehrlichii]|uniref:Uncharacterized protein n=1 Tax=Alkalilimnicola ehrlichii TaxID=351052 RepID=A0A3E0WMB0_9GAMM|nr:hypothetical protein CAI21_14450 [Alkalilimnicola ehrlichii]RFA33549.1 hypothetical protein CAL65_16975 [Alkalilimnicola ehrlichii]